MKRKLNAYGWSDETTQLQKQYSDQMGSFLFNPSKMSERDFLKMEATSEKLRQSKFDDVFDSDGKIRSKIY